MRAIDAAATFCVHTVAYWILSVRVDTLASIQLCGPVAQLGARFHGMEEVIGSIPIRSTNKPFKISDLELYTPTGYPNFW